VIRYTYSFLDYSNPEAGLWNDQCASSQPTDMLSFGCGDNIESNNWITMQMLYPVDIHYWTVQTYNHPGQAYHGNSRLYGSTDGSTWVSLATFAGDGLCVTFNAQITDSTKYSYYKYTMWGNARGCYQSISNMDMKLFSFPGLITRYDGSTLYIPSGVSYYTLFWVPECISGSCDESRLIHFQDVGNSEANNQVVFDMLFPVAISSYSIITRTANPGACYMGNTRLYGSQDRSTWTQLVQLTGDGVGATITGSVSSTTAWAYYKFTMFNNARTTYESASHIVVVIRD